MPMRVLGRRRGDNRTGILVALMDRMFSRGTFADESEEAEEEGGGTDDEMPELV